jgi:hypothetical protein
MTHVGGHAPGPRGGLLAARAHPVPWRMANIMLLIRTALVPTVTSRRLRFTPYIEMPIRRMLPKNNNSYGTRMTALRGLRNWTGRR